MKELKFNPEYYQDIADGLKTQTLRKNQKDINVDDVILAVFPGSDKTLTIKIVKTGYRMFRWINMDDAVREGYDSVADLKNDLLKIYPDTNHGDRFYYYQFEVVEE